MKRDVAGSKYLFRAASFKQSKGNLMITFLLGVVVVVVGLALGAGLEMVIERLERSVDVMPERTDNADNRQGGASHRWQLFRFLVSLVAGLTLLVVAVTAVPFGWGAISLLLVDRLSLGVAAVYIGLVLFRLVRRAGRELE